MKIAYFLAVYKHPALFKRLLDEIYDPANFYLVHVDKKSDRAVHEEIRRCAVRYPNVEFMESHDWIYGGYSAIEIQLNAIRQLVNRDWNFFINLTGQDFPLKTQSHIRRYLAEHRDRNFLHVMDCSTEWASEKWRTNWYFVEYKIGAFPVLRRKRVWPLPIRRSYPKNYKQYGGSTWFIASRRFCEFVCFDRRADELKKFYRNTYIPEEEFFQTLIMNSEFRDTVVPDNKRLIEWRNNRIHTFTMDDADTLAASDAFFARKFDDTVDSQIINFLSARLQQPASVRG